MILATGSESQGSGIENQGNDIENQVDDTTRVTPGSCRIDIESQGDFDCCPQPVCVQSNMPAEMTGHMSARQWDSFRNEVNKGLEPLTQVKQGLACAKWFATLGLIFLFIGGATITWDCLFFVVVPFLPFIGLKLAARQGVSEVEEQLKAVCARISEKHGGMTFHVRDEVIGHERGRYRSTEVRGNYIEVTVAEGAAGGPSEWKNVSGCKIRCRTEPDMEKKAEKTIESGETVDGFEEGEWLRTDDGLYLPTKDPRTGAPLFEPASEPIVGI